MYGVNFTISRGPTLSAGFALVLLVGMTILPGCASDHGKGRGDGWFGGVRTPWSSPDPARMARQAFNVYNADARREAVGQLSAAPFGGESSYVRTYRRLLDDPDATVRAAAIQALGTHGSVADAKRIQPALKDPSAFVRWQAAKALQRIHNQAATDPLLDVLKNDKDPDARMAAAVALGQYPRSQVFQALVGALLDTRYGVAASADQSLRTLTGRRLGDDPANWLAWEDHHADKLFAHQQPYYYTNYLTAPSLLDKMKFWRGPTPLPRRRPVGLEPSGAPSNKASRG